jgi:hypothetical protein
MTDFLLKEFVDFAGEKVDDLKKFRNPLLEAIDGPGTKLFLNQVVNRYVSPLIPEEVKLESHEAQMAVVEAYKDSVLTEEEKEDIAIQLADIPEKIIERVDLNPGVQQMVKATFDFIDGVLKEVIK